MEVWVTLCLLRLGFLGTNYSFKTEVKESKRSQFCDLDTPGKSLVQDQGETWRLFE